MNKLQRDCVYLGVSLFSSFCVTNNMYIKTCTNIVGAMCFFDLFFINKKDMMLHHLFVLNIVHYMNTNKEIEMNNVLSVGLKTEISSIFLILNNYLENNYKIINHVAFVSTFFYYRIYNYSLLLFDKYGLLMFNDSKNKFYYYEIQIGIHGLYIVNLYWSSIILKTLYKKVINAIGLRAIGVKA